MKQVGYLLKEHLDVVLKNEIYDYGIDVYNVAFLLINKDGYLLDFGYKADENGNELTTQQYKDSKEILKEKLNQLVDKAHLENKKVFISVGGHPSSVPGKNWNELMSNTSKIRKFAYDLNEFIRKYNLDGIDIDCEQSPTFCKYGRYVNFIRIVNHLIKIKNPKKIVSVAISASPYHIFGNLGQLLFKARTLYNYINWANVMAYDFPTSCCIKDFSKVGFAKFSIHSLNSIYGIPKRKQRLGIPLYGRKDQETLDYRLLVGKGANPKDDEKQYDGFYYTTFKKLKHKVDLGRKEAGGLMYWSLKMDTKRENSKSLLRKEAGGLMYWLLKTDTKRDTQKRENSKSLLRKVDDYLEVPQKPNEMDDKCSCFKCCWIFSIFCCFPNC